MVDVEQLVDPELEGLLRELASRPRSVFLRSSRKEALRVLRSRTTEPVSALAVSDALERELVTVHRAELAEILKQACRTKLLEGEREKLFVMRYRTAAERIDPVSIRTISGRLERAKASGVAAPWAGAMTDLEGLLSVRSGQDLSVLDLAALGQRIQPGDSWRVMSAMGLLASGNHESAVALSKAVLSGTPLTQDTLRSLEILGIVDVFAGNPGRALQTQEWACDLSEECLVGQVNRLRYALLSCQERATREAAARLEELMDPQHPLIASANESNSIRWRSGEVPPSAEARCFTEKMRIDMGPVARRLTSAL